ncbi:hypothetical protein X750_31840 [Mesorhizobium sp. LNJC394B00]|nr:hypothetical protein X750_31840 [Mesorhizobium sp. LNJC394B00]
MARKLARLEAFDAIFIQVDDVVLIEGKVGLGRLFQIDALVGSHALQLAQGSGRDEARGPI